MTEQKFTPGPWKACRSYEDFDGPYVEPDLEDVEEYERQPFTRIYAKDGTAVMDAHDLFEMKEGNARLIAAAPDLLEACEDILKSTKRGSKLSVHDKWIIQRLEQAIKRAKGES